VKSHFPEAEDTFRKVRRISTQRPFCARTVREINCRRANRILFRAGKHGEVSLRLTGQTAACNDINPNERLLVSIFLSLSPTRDDGGMLYFSLLLFSPTPSPSPPASLNVEHRLNRREHGSSAVRITRAKRGRGGGEREGEAKNGNRISRDIRRKQSDET
jgi:hypothetical protein